MHSGFSFSSLRIIESLPAKEVQTGQQLAAYLSSTNPTIPVHHSQLHDRKALFTELVQLVAVARAGEIPIVHFEAHGNFNATGLELASGETVLFSEIAPALREINLAARFNLVVFVAACGGGWLLEQVDPLQPGTCFGLVAPTDDIDPGEVMGGTRDFYRCLRSGPANLNSAISGNSGHDAGSRWPATGVFDGEEIRAAHPPHPHAGVQGAGGHSRPS